MLNVSNYRKFSCLVGRNIVGLKRNPASLIARVLVVLFVAINYVIIFWKMGNDKTKAFEITGSLFFNCISLLFLYELFTVLEF